MDSPRVPGPFQLPALPWDEAALDPVISSRTIGYHYGKHHLAYVKKLNELVAGTELESKDLEDVVRITAQDPAKKKIFNQAAQVWNHTFFWESLAPRAGGKPGSELLAMIERDIGPFDSFKDKLTEAALGQFGSGWAWLVAKDGKVSITTTSNADTPLTTGATPLLTLDVWEHAYYLDYQNDRKKFCETVIDKILNWKSAETRLSMAKG